MLNSFPAQVLRKNASSTKHHRRQRNVHAHGLPERPNGPGMHNIVIEHRQSGYVSHDGVVFDGFVN